MGVASQRLHTYDYKQCVCDYIHVITNSVCDFRFPSLCTINWRHGMRNVYMVFEHPHVVCQFNV